MLVTLLLNAVVVAALALTVTRSRISEPVRDWVADKGDTNRAWDWIAKLIHCPFCFSFWASLLVTFWMPPGPLFVKGEFFYYTLIGMGLGSIVAGLIFKLLEPSKNDGS